MAYGEYIVDRLLPGFIENASNQQGIVFDSYSDKWVLRLQKDAIRKWIVGYSFDINSTAASVLARDKVASYLAFKDDGLPAIEHHLARSRANTDVLLHNLSTIDPDRPVVIKPLEGTSGHGVHKLNTLKEAVDYLAEQSHTDWALSPWYNIQKEVRLIVCDGNVLCAYEKLRPGEYEGLKFYNLGRGAVPSVISPSKQIEELAIKALASSGLRLAAVDLAALDDGSWTIMEINEGIMMEHFARHSDDYKQVAQQVYEQVIERMFQDLI